MKASGSLVLAGFFWLLLGVFIFLPVIFLLMSPFAGLWPYPGIFPETWTTRGMDFLLTEGPAILFSLGSSFLYSLGAVLLALIFSWHPAWFLANHSFRGKLFFEGLLLAPALVPAITFAPGIQQRFIFLGIVDTPLGVSLVLALVSFPYMLRALKLGFLRFDPRYVQAGRNLGAGPFQIFTSLALPAMLPYLVSGGGLVFLIAFSEYFLVFLIGGGIVPGFPGYLVPFIRSGDRVIGSSLTLVFLIIPLGLFALQELLLARIYRGRKDVS